MFGTPFGTVSNATSYTKSFCVAGPVYPAPPDHNTAHHGRFRGVFAIPVYDQSQHSLLYSHFPIEPSMEPLKGPSKETLDRPRISALLALLPPFRRAQHAEEEHVAGRRDGDW